VKRPGIEMYNHHRFFVWTGKHLAGTPTTIEDRPAAIESLYKELVPEAGAPTSEIFQKSSCQYSDDEVLRKAINAPNAEKFTALFEADKETIARYHSQSEADLALCKMLAYWADGSVSTIDRLFRQSGLYREKWERADYREATINRALGFQERRAS